MTNPIDKDEILKVQEAWGNGIVEIGKAYLDKKDIKEVTQKLLDELYGFGEGTVVFKPTRASDNQFRLTYEGAMSYFIGRNPDYEEDKGFALQPWKNVRFENAGFIFAEKQALAMGNYFFSNSDGNETKVEYTFGYYRSKNSSLKINLHHSSLPFSTE